MKIEYYFTEDSYETPINAPRLLLDKFSLNTRAYFMAKVISIIAQARRQAAAGSYDNEAWIQSSLNIFKLVEGCGGRFHITGINNLRMAKGPVVFISNHMSNLETMTFPCIIQPLLDVTFVVKESLIKQYFFGPVMRSRNPVAVGRTNPREDLKTVMSKGQEILSEGRSLVIFPQGTRKINFVPEEFNSLGVKLAKEANVQILPVAIKTDFWENGTYLKDLGPISRNKNIYMAFGQPFPVTGNGKDEHRQVIKFISDHLDQWS